jgi:hypothetical protein
MLLAYVDKKCIIEAKGDAMPERFKIGEKVRTTRNAGRGDWSPAARRDVSWGVEGAVIVIHDSHGLCYEVCHDGSGIIAPYEHEELELASVGIFDSNCITYEEEVARRKEEHEIMMERIRSMPDAVEEAIEELSKLKSEKIDLLIREYRDVEAHCNFVEKELSVCKNRLKEIEEKCQI